MCQGAEPNAICYNAVINAWCKEGNMRRAAGSSSSF